MVPYTLCVAVSAEDLNEYVRSTDKSWFCEICKGLRKRQRLSINITDLTHVNTPTPPSSNTPIFDAPTLSNINSKLNKILENNDIVNKEIQHLKIIMEDYKKITEEIIQSNVDLQNENEELKQQINNVNFKMDKIEQQLIENNITISGIEKQNDENIEEIIIKVAKSINVEITQNDIEECYRSETRKKTAGFPPEIFIKFKNIKIKNEILENKKGKRLNTKILNDENQNQNAQYESRPLYINEQLTKYRQKLHKESRDARRENKVKYVWVNRGNVYVRKTDTSKIIKITEINQLNDF